MSVTSHSSGSTSLPPLAFLNRKYYRRKKKKLHLLYELKMNRMERTGKNQLPLAQPRGHMHHPPCLSILRSLLPAFLGSYQTCRHGRVYPVVSGLWESWLGLISFLSHCNEVSLPMSPNSCQRSWTLTVISRRRGEPYQRAIATV